MLEIFQEELIEHSIIVIINKLRKVRGYARIFLMILVNLGQILECLLQELRIDFKSY